MRLPLLLAAAAVTLAGCSAAPVAGTPAPAPATATPAKKPAQGVRGQVTAENGTTWTVTTAKGRAVTVTLTPQTAFGTKAAPAAASAFPVGSPVRVSGTVDGATVTATRIAAPAQPG